jgi:hypothetical protein
MAARVLPSDFFFLQDTGLAPPWFHNMLTAVQKTVTLDFHTVRSQHYDIKNRGPYMPPARVGGQLPNPPRVLGRHR